MHFIVSERISRYQNVELFFENQFARMPGWFKAKVAGHVIVLVGTSTEVVDRMESHLSRPLPKRVIKIISVVNHGSTVVRLFAGLLREVLEADDALNQKFAEHVVAIKKSSLSLQEEGNVLTCHLVAFYLGLPGGMHDEVRHKLCRQIAAEFEEIQLAAQGTLV
ncbi:MAG: hypothetical protein NTV02_02170 [Candidatus Zambryskibacteria bacterium]|nr:hypothetical protein [Candidatus Zambryskibacteria bacterium]